MNRKKFIFVGLCMVFIACAGGAVYKMHREDRGWINKNVMENINDLLYVEINPLSENKCIVTNEKRWSMVDNILWDGYIYVCEFKFERNVWQKTTLIKRAQVNIYDLQTRERVKTYDLKDILEQFAADTSWAGGISSYQKQGGDLYFQLWTNGEDAEKDKDIYINFTTDEIVVKNRGASFSEVDEAKEADDNRLTALVQSIVAEDEIGLMQANGIKISKGTDLPDDSVKLINFSERGYFCICLNRNSLPKENSTLYAEFPGLKDYQGEDGDMVYIYLGGYPTPEEILSMLIEEGEEISFEGCVLPAESSIDGKEHEIHSFEEYEQWKKYED